MKTKHVSLFCLILFLAGCANLSNIRQDNPLNSLTSDKLPKPLADCIAYESQESSLDSWNRFWDPARITEIDGTYKVLVTLTGGLFITTSQPMAELTITPTDSGGSKVEYRTYSMWGGKEKFWELVKKCAGYQNNPGK